MVTSRLVLFPHPDLMLSSCGHVGLSRSFRSSQHSYIDSSRQDLLNSDDPGFQASNEYKQFM